MSHYCANCGNDWTGTHSCADLPLTDGAIAKPLAELEPLGPTIEQMIEEMDGLWMNRIDDSGWIGEAFGPQPDEPRYAALGDSPFVAIRALYEKWKAGQ